MVPRHSSSAFSSRRTRSPCSRRARYNAHLLRTRSPRTLLSVGVTIPLTASIALLAVVSIDSFGLAAVVVCVIGLTCTWGVIQPNAVALGLANRPEIAGTGSAILGFAQFSTAAIAAPLVGVAGSDTAIPFALVVIGFAALSFASVVLLALRTPALTRTSARISPD